MNTKLLAVTLVILSCAWVSFAAVSIALNTENKGLFRNNLDCYCFSLIFISNLDHPGQCWESEFKKAINIGDSWQPETRCEKIYCSEGFTLDYTGYANLNI